MAHLEIGGNPGIAALAGLQTGTRIYINGEFMIKNICQFLPKNRALPQADNGAAVIFLINIQIEL